MSAKDISSSPSSRNPVVINRDGEVFADSRDVAFSFEKEHKSVLRAIRDLECSPEFRQRNFAPFKINDLSGESTSHVEMTRDGFMFLAMGFTGARAAKWKEDYIAAFNTMEAELRRAAEEKRPATRYDMMRAVIDDLEAQNQRLFSVERALESLGAHEDYLTVKAYWGIAGVRLGKTEANALGRSAAALSRKEGHQIGRQPDETHGTVNTYHRAILDKIYKEWRESAISKKVIPDKKGS